MWDVLIRDVVSQQEVIALSMTTWLSLLKCIILLSLSIIYLFWHCFSYVLLLSTERCALGVDPGPCNGSKKAFFFNKYTGECERFAYGGCLGNDNRFSTKRECRDSCSEYFASHKIIRILVTYIGLKIAGYICTSNGDQYRCMYDSYLYMDM